MPRIPLHDQNRYIVIVDGVPWQGFAEGDYIQVKLDGGAAQRTQGGDGPGMNVTVQQGGQLTIGLLPTSPVIGAAYALRDAQTKAPRLFSIQLVSGVEEVINAAGCAFGDLPQFQMGGPSMQARQFVFECLAVKMDPSATVPVGVTP